MDVVRDATTLHHRRCWAPALTGRHTAHPFQDGNYVWSWCEGQPLPRHPRHPRRRWLTLHARRWRGFIPRALRERR